MLVNVTTPRELTRFTDGCYEFAVDEETVGGALDEVFARHPDLKSRVADEQGDLYPHLKLLINQEAVEWRTAIVRRVSEDEAIEIFAFASGG